MQYICLYKIQNNLLNLYKYKYLQLLNIDLHIRKFALFIKQQDLWIYTNIVNVARLYYIIWLIQ